MASLYGKVLNELKNNGARRVRIEEPALVLDLTDKEAKILIEAYSLITKDLSIAVYVQTYYESLSQYNKIVDELPVCGIGMDFVVNSENIENMRKFGFPKSKQLIASVVSGRDIWKMDFTKTVNLINELFELTGQKEIIISNSSPLYHLPVSLEPGKNYLNAGLIQLLSFADERLGELMVLKQIINENRDVPKHNFEEIKGILKNEKVQEAVAAVKEDVIGRKESFEQRYILQKETLRLPLFPTTTIGSYPQTAKVSKFKTAFKENSISEEEYDDFIKNEIKKVVKLQEEIGLDILVHGEFERNDMVEYFDQKLKGFAFTKNALGAVLRQQMR
jgi:5-methyltetrahydropteroyltriglutamate--homocysteine methyltransferase